MNQFSVRHSARYAHFSKNLRKTGLYSKQVSSCVSHTQFQVNQLEFEHEKDFTVFRVWGGLGLSGRGGS